MESIKAELEPLIRKHGIRRTARETGLNLSSLSQWLGDRPGHNLYTHQAEMLAAFFRKRWVLAGRNP